MITIRKSEERGTFNLSWLNAKYTFSFGDYRDNKYIHFGPLRVLNDDTILPDHTTDGGFGFHPHQDMEILTFMIEGSNNHEDSMGTKDTISVGDIQYMSAGSGVIHNETNADTTKYGRLLQIWIFPDKHGYEPTYKKFTYKNIHKLKQLTPLVTKNGALGSLTIRQDAELFLLELEKDSEFSIKLSEISKDKERKYFIQFAVGSALINDMEFVEGDGAFIVEEENLHIKARSNMKILLFSL